MTNLNNTRVAIIAVDGFEEVELTAPMKALQDAGAHVEVLSANRGKIQGFKRLDKAGKADVDRTFDEVRPDQYDGLILPGGALNADEARSHPQVRHFIREMDRAGKPIGAICHAPWELISADVVKGRRLTSWHTIQDDILNAGGEWTDETVVVDQNLVTSRGPLDLAAFNREMIALFSRTPVESHR